jgi:hypothetical protein
MEAIKNVGLKSWLLALAPGRFFFLGGGTQEIGE